MELMRGCRSPVAGLWEQAQPGWRSAADMQRAVATMATANVRRRGIGSPDGRQVPAWMTGSDPPFASAAAISRISCEIFIEQYFGPHMLQKWALLKVSCGSVWS